MRIAMNVILGIAVFVLLACGSTEPGPVQVIGGAEDLSPLTGEWSGTYDSLVTGRSGSITFHLTENPEGAHGDVLLVPKREFVHHDPQSQRDQGLPYEPVAGPAVLSIEFVRVAAGEISGRIAPYPDPDAPESTLETHFTGHLDGDWIEGTFVTYPTRGVAPQRGTWRVHRKSARRAGM